MRVWVLTILMCLVCSIGWSEILLEGETTNVGDRIYNTISWTGTDEITISYWIYVASTDVRSSYLLISNQSGGLCSTALPEDRVVIHSPWSDNILYWDYGNATEGQGRISTSFSAYENKWTHVVLVSSGSLQTFQGIYLNGVLVTSQSTSRNPSNFTGVCIGGLSSPPLYQYTKAKISEFAIWNTQLNASEVISLFSKVKRMPLQIKSANLKLYYPLDDQPDGTSGDGDTFRDLSSNGNNGTGDDGVNNTGLTVMAEEVLTYP